MTVELGTGLTILAMVLAGVVFYFKGTAAFQRHMENMSKSFTTDLTKVKDELKDDITVVRVKQENHDVRLTQAESNVTALFGRINSHVNGKH